MKERTSVEALYFPDKITHGQKILTMGSCFAEVMGERLKSLPLEVMNQPLGTVFHPLSMLNLLEPKKLKKEHCYTWENKYVHPFYHSRWKGETAEELFSQIEQQQSVVQQFVQQSDWLFITFGTAYYYFDTEFEMMVANCHKQSQSRFVKRISSISDILEPWNAYLKRLFEVNPGIHVLFTVSPVRHTKDGIQNNQVSKSTLRLVVEELVSGHDRAYYFPAYEYMLDELRDYHFYKGDLIHPNEEAEEFIYKKLVEYLLE